MSRQHLNKSLVLLRQQLQNSRSSTTSNSILSSSSTLSSPTTSTTQSSSFSTTTTTTSTKPKKKKINLQETLTSPTPHPQAFVTHRLRPGQPNPLSQIYKKRPSQPSDPIYRPAWRQNTKANIISAEDFANRPRVSFEEQFDSLHDGMIVLSWLNETQRQDIYNTYTQMMIEQDAKFGVTSHEYVMRVIGEKFNVSTARVGAIVQFCHTQEQMAKTDPEMIHEKVAEYVDAKIQEHIANVYNAYGEVNPNEFIEPPVESSDIRMSQSSGEFVAVEDLYDVDELTKEAILREKDEARLEIDGHMYKEDMDDDEIESKVNKECLDLIEKQKEAFQLMTESWGRDTSSKVEYPLPKGGSIDTSDADADANDEDTEADADTDNKKDIERRPRWKYVAQTINVSKEKQEMEKMTAAMGGRRTKLKKKEKITNTLVEQDGVLRVATMKEVNDVAWKDVRNSNEFGFKGVKSAWLKRKAGERGGWGRVPDEVKAAARAKLEKEEAELFGDENENDGESDNDNGNDQDSPDINDEKEKK